MARLPPGAKTGFIEFRKVGIMSALVRNHRNAQTAPTGAPGGFGLGADADIKAQDQIGHVALTILLVLYPALASVTAVIAAFLLSGSRGFV
jgi:hypothetical protein